MKHHPQPGPAGDMNRLHLRGLDSSRTLGGVVLFVILAMLAMAVIGMFAASAARQNATALVYGHAELELQMMLRGLNEAAITNSSLASEAVIDSGLAGFRAARQVDAELDADTRGAWPALEGRIAGLMRERHQLGFDDDAMIELGRITTSVDKLAAVLHELQRSKRESAAQAELRVQTVNIAVGAFLMLGTAVLFVTRERAAQRVLDVVSASESQLRDITDAVPDMIAYIDSGRCFRFHNQAYEQTLGLTREQISGRTMREVFGDEVYAALQARVDQVLAGSPVHFDHTRNDASGGPRNYSVHFFPRHSHDRTDQPVIGFYSLLTDVTEIKRIDRMKTEFVSTVSHELRTPLTSIRGSLGLLSGGVAGSLPDTARNLIEIARNNCERLIRLINDILDTEKIESGQMRLDLKVIDLRSLIAQTLAANEGFAGQHQVTLALHGTGVEMRAEVDADRFIQALTNLLSNAIKFSRAQSTVDVTMSHRSGSVRVEVRDHGPGIPEEFRSRIFQKFSQADSSDSRQKSGSGLGLNISKSIVERLGGTIGFTTEAGVGTRFFFELPQWQETPLSLAEAA